ncbi:MAG: hypothetical protein IPM64_06630 [Phycisphaerales bacterium]|nr:hypothetical protein [Phycisphaerales bacterium]
MKFVAFAAAFVLLSLSLGGCPQQGNGGVSPTAAEESGIHAANSSARSLAQALSLLQFVATDGAARISSDGSLRSVSQGRDVTFGSCPEVTLSGTTGVNFTLSAVFPGDCALLGVSGYTCGGAATGTYNALTQSITANFNALRCNERSLDGTAEIAFLLAGGNVTVNGAWTLAIADGSEQVATTGTGIVTYDPQAKRATVQSFSGTCTQGDVSLTLTLTSVRISYSANGNLRPSAGTATLSGDGIRTMTVTFDEDTPATGVVTVQIGSAAAVKVDLDTL